MRNVFRPIIVCAFLLAHCIPTGICLLHAQVSGSREATAAGSPSRTAGRTGAGPKKPSMTVESVEGIRDTVSFHIGSPLFLRFRISGDARICTPFNGQFFYFDATGGQLGWGFEEVTDSLLFPHVAGDCWRVVMLSSEHSNSLAEGYYTMRGTIFLNAKNRIPSNIIVLHPVHSPTGADDVSYLRFLQEQLLKNSSLLRDPATLQALFDAKSLTSAESELYHAVALYKLGDMELVVKALENCDDLAAHGTALSPQARSVRQELLRRLKPSASNGK